MFGRRADGKELKHIPAEFRLMPLLMKERSDSQVFFKQDIVIENLEQYLAKKNEEGIKYSIMDVVFTAVARIIAERPKLNRFVINGRTYARNDITISITIKKSLSDTAEETEFKMHFTGKETLQEVHDELQRLIAENKVEVKNNGTDKLARFLSNMPHCLLSFSVGLIKFLDNRGLLPKSIIEVSPFHTSAFITNVGSIGIDSIYHHIYNFGNTSLFFAIGKKKKSYVFEDEEIKQEKCISFGFVGDERICDGYYYAQSFKALNKYLRNPELLETPLEKVEVDTEI